MLPSLLHLSIHPSILCSSLSMMEKTSHTVTTFKDSVAGEGSGFELVRVLEPQHYGLSTGAHDPRNPHRDLLQLPDPPNHLRGLSFLFPLLPSCGGRVSLSCPAFPPVYPCFSVL